MIEESNKSVWLALAFVLVFHLLLVSLPADVPAGPGFARSLIMDALTPAQRLVDAAGNGVTTLWHDYFALLGTREENARLHAEVDQLRMQIQRDREAILEAGRLRRFFSLDYPIGEATIIARVTGADPTVSQRTVTLDQGYLAGYQPGVPILTPDGIVGRVVFASRYSSIVQLVTDSSSAVSALVQSSRVQGIVRGNGSGQLVFEHSEDGAHLMPGDEVVTSGRDRIYPKGLPIGVIVSVGPVADLVSTAVVEPSADLGRLEEVLSLKLVGASSPGPGAELPVADTGNGDAVPDGRTD